MDTSETVKPALGMEPEVKKGRRITVADLTTALNSASQVMSSNNPHKVLILNAASALQQLVQQLENLQNDRSRNLETIESLRSEVEKLKEGSGGFVIGD